MPSAPDDKVWEWVGPGTPDADRSRGRVFYKQFAVRQANGSAARYFRVGDAVVIAGNGDESWIAHIVDLFQAHEGDAQLRDRMTTDIPKGSPERRCELMRCTLRWFYLLDDMNKHTLQTSPTPKPLPGEIWFSDHVDDDGFNEIQVITGKAWLFSTPQAVQSFLKQPNPDYHKRTDKLRLVRCFVDYEADAKPVRELGKTELGELLSNPSTSKDLYQGPFVRLHGSAGAVFKGTGSKRKRRAAAHRSPALGDRNPITPEKKSRLQTINGDLKRRHKSSVMNQNTSSGKTSSNGSARAGEDDGEDLMDDEPLSNRIVRLSEQKSFENKSQNCKTPVAVQKANARDCSNENSPNKNTRPKPTVAECDVIVIDDDADHRARQQQLSKAHEKVAFPEAGAVRRSRVERPNGEQLSEIPESRPAANCGGKEAADAPSVLSTEDSLRNRSAVLTSPLKQNGSVALLEKQTSLSSATRTEDKRAMQTTPSTTAVKVSHQSSIQTPKSGTSGAGPPSGQKPSSHEQRSSKQQHAQIRQVAQNHTKAVHADVLKEISHVLDSLRKCFEKVSCESRVVILKMIENQLDVAIDKIFDV